MLDEYPDDYDPVKYDMNKEVLKKKLFVVFVKKVFILEIVKKAWILWILGLL